MMKSIHSLDDIAKKRGGQGVLARLQWIDDRIHWAGSIRRTEICAQFDVSPQQASADIATYLDLSPGAMRLNNIDKAYYRVDGHVPVFPKSASQFLSTSLGDPDILAFLPTMSLIDMFSASIIGKLIAGFRQRRKLRLRTDQHNIVVSHHAIFECVGNAFLRCWNHGSKAFETIALTDLNGIDVLDGEDFVERLTDVEWDELVIVRVDSIIEADPAWPLVRLALNALPLSHHRGIRKPVVEALFSQLGTEIAAHFDTVPFKDDQE